MAYVPAGALERTSNENGHNTTDNLTNGSNEKGEFKLFVANLPGELNEEGIKQIFDSFGDVTSIFSPQNADWAYITYRTHREAVQAVGKLHYKSPLNLRVEFAKDRQAKSVNQHTRENGLSSSQTPSVNENAADHRESSGYIHRSSIQHHGISEGLRSRHIIPSYGIEDEIMYPVEHDPRTFNPFENACPYHHTNLVWTRGSLAVSANGRRQVCMGRGCTRYEIPDHYYPRIEENISSVYEKRSSGLYEYGKDSLENEIGRCLLCGNITRMRCSACSVFYCSRNCQKNDWDKHKLDCLSLPALTGVPNSIQNVQELQDKVSVLNQRKKIDASQRLTTPRNIGQQDKFSKHVPEHNLDEELKQKLSVQSETIKVSEALSAKDEEKPARKAGSTSSKKSHAEKMEEGIYFQKSFLREDKFTLVEIMVMLPNCEYWVQRTEDAENFRNLMNELKDSDSMPKVDLVVDSLVACKFYDIWHRALILSVDPLTVSFIDYGLDKEVKEVDIRSLVQKVKNVPRFSRKIFIQNGKGTRYESLKENDELSVKLIHENDEGLLTVIAPEVEKASSLKSNGRESSKRRDSQSSRKSTSPRKGKNESEAPQSHKYVKSPAGSNRGGKKQVPKELPCPTGDILDHLQAKDKGHIELHNHVGENKFSVTLIFDRFVKYSQKILVDIPKYCNEMAKSQSYTPVKEGEIILGRRSDEDWVRGIVLSVVPPVKVAAVDEGRVALVNHCLEMPSEFAEICTFAATCSFNDSEVELQPLEVFPIEVVSAKNDNGEMKVEVIMTKDNASFKAVLTNWTPAPEQIGIQVMELKTNTEVIITAFRSQSLIYVRSLEANEMERFSKLLQEVTRKAQTAPPLKNKPVIGEMVLAKFMDDGNYYRAIVSKIDGEKIFITYIDFGNVEISTIANMLEAPMELKMQPTGTAKISLKDVPKDAPMTEELSKYLAEFIAAEQPLKITFDGSPLENGVELKTASKELVNEKVKKLINPNWKESVKGECTMLDSFPCEPMGEKGTTMTAFILHAQDVGNEYFMCPFDIDLITHVQDTLPNLIKKYVDSTPDHYVPREGEMCIAPFDGIYYRAACLNRGVNVCTVFFIDYGNVIDVEQKDIRFFPKEFAKPKALSTLCKVQNFLPKHCEGNVSKKLESRINDLLKEQTPVSIKIVQSDEVNTIIEIPEIRNILLKENLF